jgi:hypothetical protein
MLEPVSLRIVGLLYCLALVAACSDTDPGDSNGSAANEPPFFVVDRHATGPLTLAELQIEIPDRIEMAFSTADRSCFLRAIERRAQEAGDPAELDPDAFPYWGGDVDREAWSQHGEYMQRVLLAQAIVSWALMDC